MQSSIYKIIEIVGTSHKSIDDAIKAAVEHAQKTVSHLEWFKVVETRGAITNQKLDQFQVVLKVGFKIESQSDAQTKLEYDATKDYEQQINPAVVNLG